MMKNCVSMIFLVKNWKTRTNWFNWDTRTAYQKLELSWQNLDFWNVWKRNMPSVKVLPWYMKILSTANKGRSIVNYHHSLAFDCSYLSFNDHCAWSVAFLRIFKYYSYFLEISLNNFELVFLEFKHTYKTQRTSIYVFFLSFHFLLVVL